MTDLTILFYTANNIPDHFMGNIQKQLLTTVGDTPIISVSHKPMDFGQNICIGEQPRSNYMIYKQVLIGAKAAKTKYVATAEDDVLYSKEHFLYRPQDNTIGYDINKWSIFTWTKPPIFSMRKGRRTMTSCIAPKETLIKTLEERYEKYPVLEDIPEDILKYYWGEPGRFEDHLNIHRVKTEMYSGAVPSVVFSTPEALGFGYLGTRKAHSPIQTDHVPGWGFASEVLKYYEKD